MFVVLGLGLAESSPYVLGQDVDPRGEFRRHRGLRRLPDNGGVVRSRHALGEGKIVTERADLVLDYEIVSEGDITGCQWLPILPSCAGADRVGPCESVRAVLPLRDQAGGRRQCSRREAPRDDHAYRGQERDDPEPSAHSHEAHCSPSRLWPLPYLCTSGRGPRVPPGSGRPASIVSSLGLRAPASSGVYSTVRLGSSRQGRATRSGPTGDRRSLRDVPRDPIAPARVCPEAPARTRRTRRRRPRTTTCPSLRSPSSRPRGPPCG